MEELIWNYLDNTCSPEEKKLVETKLSSDAEFRNKFYEISSLHQSLFTADTEEPSMRFAQNVMDTINKQVPVKPLTTTVDKRIINGIGILFFGIISVLVVYIISQTSFGSSGNLLNFNIKMPEWSSILFNNNFITVFLMFDCVLLLFFFDKYLRRNFKH